MSTPAQQAFPYQLRGELRTQLLQNFASGARTMINPTTGAAWSAAEIAASIAQGSPRYIEADGVDLVMSLEEQRALWLADQVRPDRASTSALVNGWSPMWGLPYLPAAGGTGDVSAPCLASTTFYGSTTLGDSAACTGIDANGLRYQVLFTATSDTLGNPVTLTLAALDTGDATNLATGSAITWSSNVPLGAQGLATVLTPGFSFGVPAETDAQFVKRLLRRIRHKQGAGNRGQLVGWAEAFSNSIDCAFAYSTPLYAGTSLVAFAAKRATGSRGPAGRIPTAGLIALLTAYLVPPGSTTVPDIGLLLVTGVTSVPSYATVTLDMPVGTDSGWADPQPWPSWTGTATSARAYSFTPPGSQHPTEFNLICDAGSTFVAPSTSPLPQIMVWDVASSAFELLDVASLTYVNAYTYHVVLNTTPATTFVQGATMISPYTKLHDTVALAAQGYFDGLGPGEIIDVSATSTDPRRQRCYRFPPSNEEWPYRAGANLVTALQDALVGSFSDGLVTDTGLSVPTIPVDGSGNPDPSAGPGILTLGDFSIYAL